MSLPSPPFTHLFRLTDSGGLYEHALGTAARPEHGYCVDDVARALVVVCRETELPHAVDGPDGLGSALDGLRKQYLSFVLAAQTDDGRFHNRRGTDLRWQDAPSIEDCWGRALWGLGAAVSWRREPDVPDIPDVPEEALAAFDRGAGWRSPHRRAMAFAALGAAEVLRVLPEHAGARALLTEAALVVGKPVTGSEENGWIWPEPRLTYANAAVPEALLAAGAALDAPALAAEGLRLLGWLLDSETCGGHLSVVPVGGRGPSDAPPGFDQQPIEVAALADACARAHGLTGQQRWLDGIDLAVSWFLGANDAGTPLYDDHSGGGCDGLESDGRNENQGAESTLALVSTLQHGRLLSIIAQ